MLACTLTPARLVKAMNEIGVVIPYSLPWASLAEHAPVALLLQRGDLAFRYHSRHLQTRNDALGRPRQVAVSVGVGA